MLQVIPHDYDLSSFIINIVIYYIYTDIKEVTREGVMDPTTPPSEASNNIPSVPMAGTTVLPDHADATSDYHTVKLLGCWLLLPKRYTYIKAIGRGSYSVAVLAYDTFKKKNVCIKTYKRVFEDVQDALTTLSEVHVRRLLNHENVRTLYTRKCNSNTTL